MEWLGEMALRRGASAIDAPTLHIYARDLASVDQGVLRRVLDDFGLAACGRYDRPFPPVGDILRACGVGSDPGNALDTAAMDSWLWLKDVLILHAERSVHGEWVITRAHMVFDRDADGELICDGLGINRRVRVKSRTPPPEISEHVADCIRAVGLDRIMENLKNADEHWARDEYLENWKRIYETRKLGLIAGSGTLMLPGGVGE